MNIAIFDLQHFEMVHVLHHVFDSPQNNISFFTNNNLINKIKNSNLASSKFSVVSTDNSDSIDDFFEVCLKHISKNNIEVIVFNTIDVHYKNRNL